MPKPEKQLILTYRTVSRCAGDERTCEACAQLDGTEALPPHADCASEYGCRCVGVNEGSVI